MADEPPVVRIRRVSGSELGPHRLRVAAAFVSWFPRKRMAEPPAEVDADDERSGWLATIRQTSMRPRAFFERFPDLRTVVGQHGAYVFGSITLSVGLALTNELLHGTLRASMLATGAVTAAVLAIPSLYLYSALVHGGVRLLRGRQPLRATRAVLAYAELPGVWGLVPFVGLVAIPWRWWTAIVGLRSVQGLGWGRAILSFFLPVVAGMGLAFGIRTFAYEAFKIPSEGMYPTLTTGDHLFVAKSAYGMFSKSLPKRGDLIVFQYPDPVTSNPPQDFVKRTIGLPGDVLTVVDGHTKLNGWLAPSCPLGIVHIPKFDGAPAPAEMFVEFLEDTAYLVVVETDLEYGRPAESYTVPEGEVYMLGDNRNNSSDSRAWRGGRGAGVPLANVKGRAVFLWLPLERFGVRLDSDPALPVADADRTAKLAACLANAPDKAGRTPPRPSR